MLSPARSVTPPEPDSPLRSRSSARRARLLVLVLGIVAAVAAVAFPFAPVQQPEVTYSWTAADGAAAIPLMPYQPVRLRATTTCAAARVDGDRTLLATVPPRPDPVAVPLSGLWMVTSGGELRITSAGVDVGTVALPHGDCTVVLASDPTRSTVAVDGTTVLTREGDVRPDVAGAFTDAADGVALTLTADTRFQTTISALKAALAVIGVLALLGMLVALGQVDRAVDRAPALLPRRWWRPRAVDAAVTAVLGLWWLVGSITVDDGYIAGIIRSRGSNGLVGNVYRWLNAPEAPFSWFYDLYYGWSLMLPSNLGASTVWMRLPSTLLGVACWWLLSRLVLPRLGPAACGARWLAALAFCTWWIPFNLGLRPEPWVAVGTLGVFLAVERAIATRRVLPLAVGLVLAGATTAVTPGGLMAFVPFLAAALPVLRLLRARRDLHVWPVLAVLAAAPASAVFLMVSDQSLAGMLESIRVRTLIGGGDEWYQEYQRYSALLEPGSFQGAIGRRAAVLFTALAAGGVLWSLRRSRTGTALRRSRTGTALRRSRAGIATGPARRLVIGLAFGFGLLTFTPTKWTQHFGDLAGYGAAVLLLGMVALSVGRERAGRELAGPLGAVTGVGALVLAGYNTWPYASGWFAPSFSDRPPVVVGLPVATLALVGGGALVLGLLARSAWLRAGGAIHVMAPRGVPGPVPVVAAVLLAVLVLQVGGLGRVALAHRDSYTLASDAVATVAGEPCGLQRALSVETDPGAGLLPVRAGAATRAERPVDVGGRTLPGIAVAGTSTTAWFTLDPAQRDGTLPVVVTTSGQVRAGDGLHIEFGVGDRVVERRGVIPQSVEPGDTRVMAPAGADTVRLTVAAPTAGPRFPAVASLPRVPRLTPMTDVLPAGSSAILDWPVAFLFPCVTPAPLPLGTADLARWRIGAPANDPAAGITYAPGFGGPFAAPRLLVTEQRMATYLDGDPTRDAVQLYRWVAITALARPEPVVVDRSVTGWHFDGHARVPGLDPVPAQ